MMRQRKTRRTLTDILRGVAVGITMGATALFSGCGNNNPTAPRGNNQTTTNNKVPVVEFVQAPNGYTNRSRELISWKGKDPDGGPVLFAHAETLGGPMGSYSSETSHNYAVPEDDSTYTCTVKVQDDEGSESVASTSFTSDFTSPTVGYVDGPRNGDSVPVGDVGFAWSYNDKNPHNSSCGFELEKKVGSSYEIEMPRNWTNGLTRTVSLNEGVYRANVIGRDIAGNETSRSNAAVWDFAVKNGSTGGGTLHLDGEYIISNSYIGMGAITIGKDGSIISVSLTSPEIRVHNPNNPSSFTTYDNTNVIGPSGILYDHIRGVYLVKTEPFGSTHASVIDASDLTSYLGDDLIGNGIHDFCLGKFNGEYVIYSNKDGETLVSERVPTGMYNEHLHITQLSTGVGSAFTNGIFADGDYVYSTSMSNLTKWLPNVSQNKLDSINTWDYGGEITGRGYHSVGGLALNSQRVYVLATNDSPDKEAIFVFTRPTE